jgi:hypothetical protein
MGSGPHHVKGVVVPIESHQSPADWLKLLVRLVISFNLAYSVDLRDVGISRCTREWWGDGRQKLFLTGQNARR